ncbi:MAG: hypothetical protein A2142_01155 [candidate division Zixibacteria bacterium RBG_16_48_11]|nr:MAG: hypothetical protein A2142_01155 [candidate division Zixibacteria bacterium RBG_16_48_11]
MRKINIESSQAVSIDKLPKIGPEFFNRPTLLVAQELLGTVLVRQIDESILTGRIVETEAYFGEDDPASHAHGGPTPRNRIMYGPAGFAYIYFIYGNHHCLNFVTEAEGFPAAVLIRALHPLAGLEIMRRNRGQANLADLTNGPGKLCLALEIDKSLNGISLYSDELHLVRGDYHWFEISNGPRVGVSQGKNRRWRFFLKDDPYVSNPIRSK